jgi:hypothetical protein
MMNYLPAILIIVSGVWVFFDCSNECRKKNLPQSLLFEWKASCSMSEPPPSTSR